MSNLVVESLRRLAARGVRLDRGLSDREVSKIQINLGFTFGPQHREFLQAAVPIGESWPNWRGDSVDELRRRLDWPLDGVVFDVHNNGFWPVSWGKQPAGEIDREREARARLVGVPTLVPVFSHRYLVSDPQLEPSPLFSVHQTDVIFYGDNLLDYVAREFGAPPAHPGDRTHVPFWSDLSLGAEDCDL